MGHGPSRPGAPAGSVRAHGARPPGARRSHGPAAHPPTDQSAGAGFARSAHPPRSLTNPMNHGNSLTCRPVCHVRYRPYGAITWDFRSTYPMVCFVTGRPPPVGHPWGPLPQALLDVPVESTESRNLSTRRVPVGRWTRRSPRNTPESASTTLTRACVRCFWDQSVARVPRGWRCDSVASWPQAAPMSLPPLYRRTTGTPRRARASWKALRSSSVGGR